MRYIHKIFHEKSTNEFGEVVRKRLEFDSTIKLGLHIKPIDQPKFYELYYVPTNSMLKLLNKIYVTSKYFEKTYENLPPIAQHQFITECLIEELYNTNELEGIRSSREEIARSTKEVQLNQHSKRRFASMITSYMNLLNNRLQLPTNSLDIRKIYDEITQGEIEAEELPDGDIFRKDATFVMKKSGSEKVVHRGITPESKIIESIDCLFKFMNNQDDIPMLIKVAISHYYFGYIHPFYDGNGRTSRFISSMYLSKYLGTISSISLSRGSNKYKNRYLDAFEITNSIKSRGELNYFIETFLSIIHETLFHMNSELKEKSELLNLASNKLNHEMKLNNKEKIYMDVMFILAQNFFFDHNNGVTIKEIANNTKKSEATIRKITKELKDMELIVINGERPVYCSIKDFYFDA